MSASERVRAAALLFSLLVALLPAGCAGEDNGRAESDERLACMLDAEAQAKHQVVSEHLAEGKLGTAPQIERELRAIDSPGFEPVSFLTRHGQLLPLDQMTDAQRATFETWRATDRVQNVIHEVESRAIREAQQEACPADE